MGFFKKLVNVVKGSVTAPLQGPKAVLQNAKDTAKVGVDAAKASVSVGKEVGKPGSMAKKLGMR